MDNKFAIRLARIEDAKKLAEFCELLRKSLDMSVHSDKLLSGVSAPIKDRSKGMYLVATESDNSTLIGCLMITYEWDPGNNAFTWWIQEVFVDSNWRRKGVFQALYKHTIKMAKDKGNVCTIKIHVNDDNLNAQKIYKRLGMIDTLNFMYEFKI
ncbi:MAG: GNAT family N-acetyltransferase [Dehalococcoidia bacterium]|nr:GNAT family N-acetyltransferase [Dehalococcoidia bacterium]